MKMKTYNHNEADRWEDVILKRFNQQLTNRDRQFLQCLRLTERKSGGFCKPVVNNLVHIGMQVGMARDTVRGTIKRLADLLLLEHVRGQAVINGAATQLRRRTLKEIETGVPEIQLHSHTPLKAQEGDGGRVSQSGAVVRAK